MVTVVGAVEVRGARGQSRIVKVLPITVAVSAAMMYLGQVWKHRQLLARYEKGGKDVTKG